MGKQVNKVNLGRKRPRYTKEFKLEAVRLLERGEKTGAQLALELGVARNQLYKWQEQLRVKGEDNAFRGPGAKLASERSEIERLKREVKELREERDILKKAAACSTGRCNTLFFSSDLGSAVHDKNGKTWPKRPTESRVVGSMEAGGVA